MFSLATNKISHPIIILHLFWEQLVTAHFDNGWWLKCDTSEAELFISIWNGLRNLRPKSSITQKGGKLAVSAVAESWHQHGRIMASTWQNLQQPSGRKWNQNFWDILRNSRWEFHFSFQDLHDGTIHREGIARQRKERFEKGGGFMQTELASINGCLKIYSQIFWPSCCIKIQSKHKKFPPSMCKMMAVFKPFLGDGNAVREESHLT